MRRAYVQFEERAGQGLDTRFGQRLADRVLVVDHEAEMPAIVRRLVLDLDYPVDIVECPTVREVDGLAISSRNGSLSAQERPAATVLYRALAVAHQAFAEGERDGDTLRAILSSTLAAEPLAREEYVSVADPDSLAELPQVTQGALLSIAVKIGKVRLIDSLALA